MAELHPEPKPIRRGSTRLAEVQPPDWGNVPVGPAVPDISPTSGTAGPTRLLPGIYLVFLSLLLVAALTGVLLAWRIVPGTGALFLCVGIAAALLMTALLHQLLLYRHELLLYRRLSRRDQQQYSEATKSYNNLYEQTRKRAEDNAILLRELHHRVKNNLAGIVGLLSSAPPGADDAWKQWLARVIDRIRTMAAAHELFSGGIGQVGLGRLVDQVVPTLSVIQPGGVLVRTVVEGEEPQFATAQAVTLAMVLHELCVNAIQHGTGASGAVTIRASRSAGQTVIEVIDTGNAGATHAWPSETWAGHAPPTPASGVATATSLYSQGLGLRLVKELVSRELRGTFQLQIIPAGGAVATVQFPANNESQV